MFNDSPNTVKFRYVYIKFDIEKNDFDEDINVFNKHQNKNEILFSYNEFISLENFFTSSKVLFHSLSICFIDDDLELTKGLTLDNTKKLKCIWIFLDKDLNEGVAVRHKKITVMFPFRSKNIID